MKLKKKFNMDDGDRIFFISDLHYGHENILKFCDRVCGSDIEVHNKWLMDTLESDTKPGDIIFDLGDMFWKQDTSTIISFLEKFKDRIWYKILGNHDSYELFVENSKINGYFEGVFDSLELDIKYKNTNYQVVLSHFPFISWSKKQYGALHLFGHCHGNIDSFVNSRNDLMVDVGVDGELAHKIGSFVIPFEKICENFYEKTGHMDFRTWTIKKCNEL